VGVSSIRRLLAVLSLFAAAACSAGSDVEGDYHGDDPDQGDSNSADRAAVPTELGGFVHYGCTTEPVLALSRQIADEVACLRSDALVKVPASDTLVFDRTVLPYFAAPAAQDLQRLSDASGQVLVESGYRTVVQQYLLYQWYQAHRCSIPVAAHPGRSNHETGRAIDVRNADRSLLRAHNFRDDVPGDSVHYDHADSPDLTGVDVLAFQRLWNRNHPEDPIAEDGDYADETERRIEHAPPQGFSQGACQAAAMPMQMQQPPMQMPPPTDPQPDMSAPPDLGEVPSGDPQDPQMPDDHEPGAAESPDMALADARRAVDDPGTADPPAQGGCSAAGGTAPSGGAAVWLIGLTLGLGLGLGRRRS
jgi:hypothetical protein